jgi:hypothetical protein
MEFVFLAGIFFAAGGKCGAAGAKRHFSPGEEVGSG